MRMIDLALFIGILGLELKILFVVKKKQPTFSALQVAILYLTYSFASIVVFFFTMSGVASLFYVYRFLTFGHLWIYPGLFLFGKAMYERAWGRTGNIGYEIPIRPLGLLFLSQVTAILFAEGDCVTKGSFSFFERVFQINGPSICKDSLLGPDLEPMFFGTQILHFLTLYYFVFRHFILKRPAGGKPI